MNDHEAYLLWLKDVNRSLAERESRWRPLAPPIPLLQWREIEAEHQTWDVAVECSDLPPGASDAICGLGYYGKAVQKGDGYRIHNGIPYDEEGFIVTRQGVDGSDEKRFPDHVEALAYVLARAQWWTGAQTAHSDYSHYYLVGFEYPQWSEHTA